MKPFLMTLLLVALTSCGGIIPDNGSPMSAIKAGFPTVEIDACGKKWLGLAVCTLTPEQDISALNISFQGYYQGSYRVVSSGCPEEIDDSSSYGLHQKIKPSLTGTPEKDCLVSVVMSPKYKNQDSSGVVVEPVEGQVYIRKTTNNSVIKTSKTIRNDYLEIESDSPSRIRMISSFCDVDYDRTVEPFGGKIRVNLAELTNLNTKRMCIMNGASVYTGHLLLWYAAIYDPAFVPLAKPRLEIDKKKLKVTADSSVSVISFDEEYAFSREKTFKFDSQKTHIIRVLTAKGRVAMAQWLPETQEWSWK